MCRQNEVLKKIRKAGKINGYSIELAEAQAEDFVQVRKEIKNINRDISAIKTEQAVQGGKIDLILQRLNGPVDEQRKKGMVAESVMPIFKTWKAWAIIIFILCCIALAGDKVLEILGWLPRGV